MFIAAPLSTISVPGCFIASHCGTVAFWILGIPETVSPENNSLACSFGFGLIFFCRLSDAIMWHRNIRLGGSVVYGNSDAHDINIIEFWLLTC